MSYAQYSRSMVQPQLIYVDQFGHSQTFNLSPYVSGYLTLSKAESVKRPRPTDLKSLSSLTGFGTHTEDDIQYGSFSVVQKAGLDTYRYIDLNPQDYFPVGRVCSAPDPQWAGKLRLAVKDQKVNLAQSMAEYKQTQDMFVKNAKTIWEFGRWLKRGRGKNPFQGPARIQKSSPTKRLEITNRYLEYQFGVKPLLQDIAGAVEELESACQRPHYRTVNVSCSEEVREKQTGTLYLDGRPLLRDASDKVTIKVKAIVLGESLAEQRLGFTNPITLAWELLPYSFVVDYFIGVGNWLNGLDAMVGIQQCYGTVTRKSKYICTTSLGGYYFVRSYGRSVFDGLPGSDPAPRWKPSLGFTRITNILALLSQLKR